MTWPKFSLEELEMNLKYFCAAGITRCCATLQGQRHSSQYFNGWGNYGLLKSLCLHSALSVYGNPVRVFVKELQSFNIIPVPHALDVQLF